VATRKKQGDQHDRPARSDAPEPVCQTKAERVDIRRSTEGTSHLQKLIAYERCRIYFHLTYAYVDEPGTVLKYLQQTAKQDAPDGISFVEITEFPFLDSRPPGFIATYTSDAGGRQVVFLVLDLSQSEQNKAAKTAAKTNPRNLGKKKEGEQGS
jgi:hypothetical protein